MRAPVDPHARRGAPRTDSANRGVGADLRAVLAVAAKDLRQEWRSRAVTVATLFFSGLTLVVLAFALGRDAALLREVAPGALWVALAFAGVIAAAQSWQADLADNALDQLLASPVPRAAVFLGKLVATWLTTGLLGTVLLPVTALLFDVSFASGWWLVLLAVWTGTFGFAVVATFYAAMTANLQARESLLPVLMFPIVVPVLLAAVRATQAIVQLGDQNLAVGWIQLLAGFDLVYFVVTTATFHFVVEE